MTLVSLLLKYLSNNEIEKVFEKLFSIFSLSNSDYLTDIVLLKAQYSKLKSEKRRNLLTHEQSNLTYNKILSSVLSLIEEIKKHPIDFDKYLLIEQRLDSLEELSIFSKDKLLERLSYVKNKNLNIKALWIDDNPMNQEYEREVLSSIGLDFDLATSSTQALQNLNIKKYEIIISDIARNGNPKEGLTFVNEIIKVTPDTPIIFFIGEIKPELGTPPFVFGITNLVSELFHLLMDVIERKN